MIQWIRWNLLPRIQWNREPYVQIQWNRGKPNIYILIIIFLREPVELLKIPSPKT